MIDAYLGAHHDSAARPRRGAGPARRGRGGHRGGARARRWPTTLRSPTIEVDLRARAARTTGDRARCFRRPTTWSPATCPASTSSTAASSSSSRASWSASSAPTAPASRPCSRRMFGLRAGALGDRRASRRATSPTPGATAGGAGVGYVPQNNNVFPRLTVEENLEMGLYLRPKEFERAVRRACASCSRCSGERRKQRAGSLSGGERQMWPWAGR